MNNLSSTLKDEDEDEVITQIKSIASEIFSEELDDPDPMGIHLGFMSFCANNRMKNYSYTERGMPDDRQECQSQWISYKNFQNTDDGFANQDSYSKPYNQIKLQKGLTKQVTYPTPKNIKKQNKKQTQKPESTSPGEEKPVNKIRIENLEQYGFMKQTGKLKKDLVDQLYKKKQKSEEENIKPKKRFKTLEELYAEKEPLYDKYLKEKQKKIKAIYESRIQEEYRFEEINPIPEINKNIVVDGTFQQRLKEGPKKTQQAKSKIMSDMLQGSTFRPQTNQTKKYKEVKSVVKGTWTQKINKTEMQNKQVPKKPLVVESKKKIKPDTYKYASLKLNSTQELKKILELDDSFQK